MIGTQFTRGDASLLPRAVDILLKNGVDVLLPLGESATLAVRAATNEVPIVSGFVADPVGSGIVKSFAKPGGNITGVTGVYLLMAPKRL